jgi:hypothetical protein
MTDERLADELAVRVLGWRPAPGRYITTGRGWIPDWRFRPMTDLANAFELLDRAANRYSIRCDRGAFKVEVQAGSHRGQASGDDLARSITLAVAQAVGLGVQP